MDPERTLMLDFRLKSPRGGIESVACAGNEGEWAVDSVDEGRIVTIDLLLKRRILSSEEGACDSKCG